MNDFALRIRRLMEMSKLNQRDLSNRIKIKESDISRYLNNGQIPRADNLLLIAKALNTTPNYLLGFDEDTHTYEDERLYVVLSGGCIGYVENVCTCDECKKRGEVEIFIHGLDGKYLDCIRHHELFDKSRVVNVGRSIAELSLEHSDTEIARFISEIYQDELFKSDSD